MDAQSHSGFNDACRNSFRSPTRYNSLRVRDKATFNRFLFKNRVGLWTKLKITKSASTSTTPSTTTFAEAEAQEHDDFRHQSNHTDTPFMGTSRTPSSTPGNTTTTTTMPGMDGTIPPGMGSFMETLLEDPELQQAMQNPKVIAAFSELMQSPGGAMGLMSNPAKMQQLMADPEVGPVLQKIMMKFMGGGAAMPGFGGNAGGAGRTPTTTTTSSSHNTTTNKHDDIPNMDFDLAVVVGLGF